MAKDDVHVVPDGDNWKVTQEGRGDVSHDRTQKEADQVGRDTARGDEVEYNLHRSTGQVRVKDSYGNDPAGAKG